MSTEIKNFLTRYLTRAGTASELDELSRWIEKPENRREFAKYVETNYAIDFNMKEFGTERHKNKLLNYIAGEKRKRNRKIATSFFKYAAIALLFVGLGYLYTHRDEFDRQPEVESTENSTIETNTMQISVGSDKASLTLEDGLVIQLEKGKKVQTENSTSNGEQIVYGSQKNSKDVVAYNFLTVPRGGQFQIKLADGTLVWLNSDSKLKYPVAFAKGKTRQVELLYGEAYFDVSPSTNHKGAKFKVLHRSQTIEVLGTEFNVKAYKEEMNIYTTLVRGKVSVSIEKDKSILVPGQQSDLDLENSKLTKKKADVGNEIIWMKGIFSFKDMPLDDIARVVSRWYDVDILFAEPELKNKKYNGLFRKDEPLEDILESILNTKTIKRYDIEGKTVSIE